MSEYDVIRWQAEQELQSHKFTCSFCDSEIASCKGWSGTYTSHAYRTSSAYIYVCHKCGRPTLVVGGCQFPTVAYGSRIENIPEKSIADLYSEARRCTTAGAYTAAVLCCRKIMMHVAVAQGASENDTFQHYVEYLVNEQHVAKNSRGWLDYIREKGNELNHQIAIATQEDAERLMSFTEMLLRTVYDFPSRVPRKEANDSQE